MATEYFSHDYRAREDPKMKRLFMDKGLKGIGLYWLLVEMLYEKSGYINLSETSILAFDFRTNKQFLESVIKDYDLFKVDGDRFYSESCLKRLKIRGEKKEKARQSVNKRWEKIPQNNDSNTDVIRTYNDSNTKSYKGERGKGKEKVYIHSTSIITGGDNNTREEPLPPIEFTVKDCMLLYETLCPTLFSKEKLSGADTALHNAKEVLNAIEAGFDREQAERLFIAAEASEWLKTEAESITLAWIIKKRSEIMAGQYSKVFGKKEKTSGGLSKWDD